MQYYPEYRLGQQWYRFTQKGMEVWFTERHYASDYLKGLVTADEVRITEEHDVTETCLHCYEAPRAEGTVYCVDCLEMYREEALKEPIAPGDYRYYDIRRSPD